MNKHLLETVLPRSWNLSVWALCDGTNDVGLRVYALTRRDDFCDVTLVFHETGSKTVDENHVRSKRCTKKREGIPLLFIQNDTAACMRFNGGKICKHYYVTAKVAVVDFQ